MTEPLRCIMPKMGGLLFAAVPQRRLLFKRCRLALRFFFDRIGFTFMTNYSSTNTTSPSNISWGHFRKHLLVIGLS